MCILKFLYGWHLDLWSDNDVFIKCLWRHDELSGKLHSEMTRGCGWIFVTFLVEVRCLELDIVNYHLEIF